MKKYTTLVAVLLTLLALSTSCEKTGPEQKKTKTLDIEVRRNVHIPMRDGIALAANISLPKASGRFPVILTRTPYGKGNAEDDLSSYFAAEGYVFVIQDCRGTGDSEGAWEPVVNERNDGLDTQKWILAQPWCNGRIATTACPILALRNGLSRPMQVIGSRRCSR